MKAKTFCSDFDEQLDIAERLYGVQIRLHFTRKDVSNLLEVETCYPEGIKGRSESVMADRKCKYQYLFH